MESEAVSSAVFAEETASEVASVVVFAVTFLYAWNMPGFIVAPACEGVAKLRKKSRIATKNKVFRTQHSEVSSGRVSRP
jgi:hypothetical protein